MLRVIIFITSSISLCLLIYFLLMTTPVTAGPFGILTVFISAYLLLLGLITYLINRVSRVFSRLSVFFISKKPFEPLTLKQSYYYSTVIAIAPIMIIGLQSVGVVGAYEYILVAIFVIIGCLYVSKKQVSYIV